MLTAATSMVFRAEERTIYIVCVDSLLLKTWSFVHVDIFTSSISFLRLFLYMSIFSPYSLHN